MSVVSVYLALGSNMGDKEENLKSAILNLNDGKVSNIYKTSSIFVTEPKYVTDQPEFLNMVVKGTTEMDAIGLLNACKRIEKEMGRNFQERRFGPRIIDIDILFYDLEIISEEQLTIPHPKIAERRFVLEPLAEIAGEFVHPQLQQTLTDLLNKCQDFGQVHKIKSTHSWISH
ncbi:MAG: 2-amino-4-hydroxy-6-hydroxymethyldihydropteridine diphosphokinase [Candidatus Marinimicrobia bacterium]|nr:2-amino-4-hydroxy-6-hydroxymethyldihydropteridine diphosphokinase [Candidatus Neomarinimicrobiota bacterium]